VIGSVIGREEYSFLYLRGLNDEAFLDDYADRLARPAIFNPAPSETVPEAATIRVNGRTYNSIAMRVTAPVAGVLELRDAFFPFWHAQVNGREVPITRTSRGLKSVELPAGASDVRFEFSPTVLRAVTAAAYGAAAGVALLWLIVTRSSSRARRRARAAVPMLAARSLPQI
jgi:hypothetical protein